MIKNHKIKYLKAKKVKKVSKLLLMLIKCNLRQRQTLPPSNQKETECDDEIMIGSPENFPDTVQSQTKR